LDISLVILAAGIGSRFGGVKQLESVGPHGELIIDYSIHDAIKAGFNKVVFILRRNIFDDFMEVIGNRMEKRFSSLGVKWEYVFQETDDMPEGRTKPLGTGQAVLACKDVLDGPFAVINADDYYGIDAYNQAYKYLSSQTLKPTQYGMVGYILRNTLSENGGVTRGICHIDADGKLTGVDECKNILTTPDRRAMYNDAELDLESIVSMNFWMLPVEYIGVLEKGFPEFLANMKNPLKDEYLLPIIMDDLLKKDKCTIDVLLSQDAWCGVTYREDLPPVIDVFRKLYADGVYNDELYSDVTAK